MAWMLLPHDRTGPRPKRIGKDWEKAVLYTHYDYLELPPGASSTRIEAAYRTIKQRLNGDTDEALIRLIHEAYAVLSNPKQRQGYDESLRREAEDADAELKALLDEKGARITRHVQDIAAPLASALTAWAA